MLLDYLYDYEALVRFASFVFVFAAFAIWELLAPRRAQQYPKSTRWINNLSITLLNTLITRLAIPLAAVAMAVIAQQQNLGLLNHVNFPVWLLNCPRCADDGSRFVFSTPGFSSCTFFMAIAPHAPRRPRF